LGPVVAALLFAGRVGSSLAAELALMKTTQQFNAMEMMAVEPLHRIVAPRMMAGMLVLPVLSLIFTVVGIFGSYIVALVNLHLDSGVFWASMQDQVEFFADILTGVAKSLVFSVVVSWIALYQGYHSDAGAAGMANATTRSVVYASVIVLGFDVLLTALMYAG
jgi:phospholipid/cholesterol/gamma-HCH transport system permease protein